MGIHRQVAKMILAEHKYRPIEGEALMCGKQTVFVETPEVLRLIADAGIEARDADIVLDRATRGAKSRSADFMNDESFFGLFCDAAVRSIDVMEEEGADIIHDMCMPIPETLENTFDFIYDGGALDNVFDPVTYIKNTARMLKPGGRIVHMNLMSFDYKAYLMYSADWFHDYYAINQFADCKVYVATFDRDMVDAFMDLYLLIPWEMERLHPDAEPAASGPASARPADFARTKSLIRTVLSPLISGDSEVYQRVKHLLTGQMRYLVFAVAEKGAESTWHKNPIQEQYRPKSFDGEFGAAIRRFFSSPRPILDTGDHRRRFFSELSAQHCRYCGSGF